ncbi:MAG: 50S ribosomal protein L20 [Candidatus Omnitrophota bacterium]|jgi:large subunit ribosomal protein L20
MTKVKHASTSLKRRKKTLKGAKGQYGARSRSYKIAKEAVRKGMVSGYVGRKLKKRDFRSLWISRISAACKEEDISYSKFMDGLKKEKVDLNRKVLAQIAASDSKGFKKLVELVKK